MSDKLELLKSKLEISDYSKDSILTQYLEDAESFLLSETNRTQLNDALNRVIVDVAYHDYNVDHQFSEASRSEGGVNVSYDKNYPPRILRVINSNRQLKAVKMIYENRQEKDVLFKTKMPFKG